MKIFSAVLFLTLCFAGSLFGQKMTADEVVAKHLDSIGTSADRAATKTLIAVGDASVKSVTAITTPVVGRIVIASAGEKIFWGLGLNSADYPLEKFSFDGKDAKTAVIRLGIRSTLGGFVEVNDLMLRQGLFGGTFGTHWTMLDLANRKGKLSMDGSKKIDGKEAYIIGYSPKGGGDIEVKLYFDKETFHHVRTEYKRIASAGIGRTPDASSRFSENRITLTEDFGNYKPEGKLTLPHTYRILYVATGNSNGSTNIEWTFNLTEFAVNQTMADGTFDIDTKPQ